MRKKIVLFLLIVVIGLVFYYSWLPDPSLKSENYIPHWLLNWSNHYYNMRTAVPFVAFGFLLEAYRNRKKIDDTNLIKDLSFIQNIGIAAVVVVIAEGGQFLIKGRNPDVMDVYYAVIGSLFGGLGYCFINSMMNSKKIKNEK